MLDNQLTKRLADTMSALFGDFVEDVIREVEQGKAKRSMFAETEREREDILNGIRECEWNFEMNPLVASVRSEEIISHDFSKGWVRSYAVFVQKI